MIAMCFDLSSTCIGVTFAQVKDRKLTYAQTLPIIPTEPTGKDFGYTTKQAKTIEYNGARFKGFLKSGEVYITKTEAQRRMSAYKVSKHRHLLQDIGRQCGVYLEKVKPDIIALERNKSFNGILTTKLLAEIAGGLYFYAGMRDVTLYDYDESTVRAFIRNTIKDFDLQGKEDGGIAIDTKWEIHCRLRSYFQTHYPSLLDFETMTMDESDSLAILYYLLKSEKLILD